MAKASSSFDANAALAKARSSGLPAGWAKFTAKRALIMTRVIASLVAAAVSLGFGGYLVWAEAPLVLFQVIAGVFFALVGLGLALIGVMGIRMIRRLDDYFLVVTPEGFAQAKGDKVVALPLTDLTKIKLVRDLFTISLVITKRSGEIMKVNGIGDYGEPNQVTQRVIDACSALYPSAKASAKAEAN
jgi:hypothetical protein